MTCSGAGLIMEGAFRSKRATKVVFPQPVGPATIQVKGCFQRGSISITEQLLLQLLLFYTSNGAVLTPSASTLRIP